MAGNYQPRPYSPWPVMSRKPAGFYEPWPYRPWPQREPWPLLLLPWLRRK
jgi:hypothetical protein